MTAGQLLHNSLLNQGFQLRPCAQLIQRKNASVAFIHFQAYPSVSPHRTRFLLEGFSWNLISEFFFQKSVAKIQVPLKSDKNTRYFTWRPIHILCSVMFLRKSCRLWDNVGKYGRLGQATGNIRRMRSACRMPKATDTHSEYVILIAFPLQQWLREGTSILRHTYVAYIIFFHLVCLTALCELHMPPAVLMVERMRFREHEAYFPDTFTFHFCPEQVSVSRTHSFMSSWFSHPLLLPSWLWSVLHEKMGFGSSAGVATRYGLDGPGIESR